MSRLAIEIVYYIKIIIWKIYEKSIKESRKQLSDSKGGRYIDVTNHSPFLSLTQMEYVVF